MATPAQIQFIWGIAEQIGMDEPEVLELAREASGTAADCIEALTVREAGELLDALKEKREEARRFR